MKNFNFARWSATSLVVFVLTATLSNFNNCAPPPQTANNQDAELDSEVRIVDDWTKREITFLKSFHEVPDREETLTLDGLCGRKSQGVIRWTIKGREEISGEGQCQLGGFRIEVSDISDLDCGETYFLEALTENDEKATTYLSRKCNG